MEDEERSVVEMISDITELNDMSETLQDKEIDEAMGYLIKLMHKPDVVSSKVPALIVKLQALENVISTRANYYKYFEKTRAGTIEHLKKNTLLHMASELDKIVAALKHMNRS